MGGLRIEGTTVAGVSSRDYKATSSREQVSAALQHFVSSKEIRDLYLERLHTIRAICLSSPFFSSHEFVGSSLLFVNDRDTAGIWMIDFEKTRGVSPPATSFPRGDGYLIGLDS